MGRLWGGIGLVVLASFMALGYANADVGGAAAALAFAITVLLPGAAGIPRSTPVNDGSDDPAPPDAKVWAPDHWNASFASRTSGSRPSSGGGGPGSGP